MFLNPPLLCGFKICFFYPATGTTHGKYILFAFLEFFVLEGIIILHYRNFNFIKVIHVFREWTLSCPIVISTNKSIRLLVKNFIFWDFIGATPHNHRKSIFFQEGRTIQIFQYMIRMNRHGTEIKEIPPIHSLRFYRYDIFTFCYWTFKFSKGQLFAGHKDCFIHSQIPCCYNIISDHRHAISPSCIRVYTEFKSKFVIRNKPMRCKARNKFQGSRMLPQKRFIT